MDGELEGLRKLIGNFLFEKVHNIRWFDVEGEKYKLIKISNNFTILPGKRKIGTLKYKTKPSSKDYYSGRDYEFDLKFYLPEKLEEKIGVSRVRIKYKIRKEELVKNKILYKKYYIRKSFRWIENENLEEKFNAKEIFN